MRICLFQFDIKTNLPESNLAKVLLAAEKAVEVKRAEMICLPELFTTGFGDLDNIEDFSEVLEESTTISEIQEFTGSYKVIMCGSLVEKDGKKLYNTAFIIENGKLLGTYRKKNLFAPMREDEFLTPGSEVSVIKTTKANIGLETCYDIRFPEVSRELALQGAELIAVPANFPDPRDDIWVILLQARAIENQLFVAGVNRTGSDGLHNFSGNSCIVRPDGKQLTPLVNDESVLTATVDLDMIEEIRGQIRAFKDFENKHGKK